MLKEYDIDKLNPRPNPYAKELKKQITIKIPPSVIDYFKVQAAKLDMPIAVLVNKGSASASEILAGALKDHGLATIVGTTTFGKGLVQNTFPFADGSALKVTIAKYYTPNGNYIHSKGIEPDVTIELKTSQNGEDTEKPKNTQTDQKKMDNQLQKAWEIVKKKLK